MRCSVWDIKWKRWSVSGHLGSRPFCGSLGYCLARGPLLRVQFPHLSIIMILIKEKAWISPPVPSKFKSRCNHGSVSLSQWHCSIHSQDSISRVGSNFVVIVRWMACILLKWSMNMCVFVWATVCLMWSKWIKLHSSVFRVLQLFVLNYSNEKFEIW